MSTNRTSRVMVATSGSEASLAAVAHGAREAAARGTALELVHVVPAAVVGAPYAGTALPALRESGQRVLARGTELVERLAPHVPVTTTLLIGSRAEALVHHAEGADLLVVGTAPHDVVGRLWDGSTVVGVAARAACPVLVVPPHASEQPPGRVLVGLKDTERSEHLLAEAFALARQTQSGLRIVHAWHLASPYDEAIAERLPTPEWERHELASIEAELIDYRMTYPEVQVEVALVHGHPATIMLHESSAADVVVITRPAHGGYVHHLGRTARALIRDSACPVLVIPPTREAVAVADRPAETSLAS
ncbi:MAG: universal stress protein [Nocardioides sp.]